jgi:hypothetical protein
MHRHAASLFIRQFAGHEIVHIPVVNVPFGFVRRDDDSVLSRDSMVSILDVCDGCTAAIVSRR